MVKVVNSSMQLLNLTWGAGASVAAGILLEKLKIESKPIQACSLSYAVSGFVYCVVLFDCKPESEDTDMTCMAGCILTHIELQNSLIVTFCCTPYAVSS